MHQDRVQRIAYGGARDFGVVRDGDRHVDVGLAVHVSVADAHSAGDGRHLGLVGDTVHEVRAAPGHHQVDVLLHAEHLAHEGTVCGANDLDRLAGQASRRGGLTGKAGERRVGVERLSAAAKDGGVAGLDAQRRDVDGYVGPALVYEAYYAQRHPALGRLQAVGQCALVEDLRERVRLGQHAAHAGGHALEAAFVEEEPVEEGAGYAVRPGGLAVLLVGAQDLVLAVQQRFDHAEQGIVPLRAGRARKPPRRAASGYSHRSQVRRRLDCHISTMLLRWTTSSPRWLTLLPISLEWRPFILARSPAP